jgi:ubiquinone/menaquinone biosynthesis C-methylase UbiE
MGVRLTDCIIYEPNAYGGRLKYFRRHADRQYWDKLWTNRVFLGNYTREEGGHLPHQLKRTLLRWIKPPARVLEAGCGPGQFTVAMDALGFKAEGVDWAPDLIGDLNQRFPKIRFWCGDVRRLEVKDSTYDAVYSPGVCEHFEEGPQETLQEAHRVLQSGGILVVSTPHFNRLLQSMQRRGAYQNKPEGAFYQYAFTIREMVEQLTSQGMKMLQVLPYGALKTLLDNVPLVTKLILERLRNPVAFALDHMLVSRYCGHSCIWVARKL